MALPCMFNKKKSILDLKANKIILGSMLQERHKEGATARL